VAKRVRYVVEMIVSDSLAEELAADLKHVQQDPLKLSYFRPQITGESLKSFVITNVEEDKAV
jgi:hypothetical protein